MKVMLKRTLLMSLLVLMLFSLTVIGIGASEEPETTSTEATGTITPCYTRSDGFWGEGGGNAAESFVVELYERDTCIASASLNDIGDIINGNVYVTWSIPFAGSTDEYWNVTWAEGYPKYDMAPTSVALVIDGVKVTTNGIRFSAPDNLNQIVALAEDSTGGVKAYTSLTDACGKFDGRKVNVLRDVSESISGFYGVTLTTSVEGGVAITNTYADNYVDFNNVTLDSGVTLNIPNVYSSGSNSVNIIEGTLNISEVYYHSGDAKTTIQNGGNVTTGGMTIVRYNTDPEAGIYIYGDGNAETVEFTCNGDAIGAYSGTFYAKDAVIETNKLWLDYKKNDSEEADSYAQINANFNSSVVKVTSEFRFYKDASLTLTDTDVTAGKVQIRSDATPIISVDSDSTLKAAAVENLSNAALNAVLGEDGTVSFKVAGLLGSGTEADPYLINNIDDLKGFRNAVNAGDNCKGQYFKLTADIDLSEGVAVASDEIVANWTPIGTAQAKFQGTFDGGDHTISNMIVVGEANQGFFGYADLATIQNLKINNATVIGTDCVGGIAGQAYSSSRIENCHVSGSIKIEGNTYVGGIVGKYYTRVVDCSVIGDGVDTSYVKGVYSAPDLEGDNVGGIMGHAGEGNDHSGNVVKNITVSGTRKIGGLIGTTSRSTHLANCTVDNVVIVTTATSDYANANSATMTLGGLIGNYHGDTPANYGEVTNCTVKNVTFNGNNVATNIGPIVGGVRVAPDATACDGVIASNNAVYLSTITGSTNTFLMTAVAQIGETKYYALQDAIAAAQAGNTITLLADVTLSEKVTLPAGITLNGNGKTITGEVWADGDLTFVGHTKISAFNAGSNKPTITIGNGACLEIVGSGRMVIGHGATFNITGNITDAKTADAADLTPSLIMPGASFTGAGVTFNVTNAYIKTTASYCSSSSSASGTFDFNITNSIWEQFGKLAFESQSTAATVNFELKNSVLTTTSHLVFGVSRGEIVIDNSNVNVGKSYQIENQSTMTVKNGSVVNGAVTTSSNAKNPGTLIIDNATYAVTGEFSGSDLGTGTLIVKNGASFTADSITKANIIIDATDMTAGEVNMITANLSKFAGTLEVENNNKLEAKIVDGKIVLAVKPVASVNGVEYTDVQAAINAARNGDTVTIYAGEYSAIDIRNKNITIQGTVGTNGELLTTIKGGNPAITGHSFNGTIKDLKIVDAWKVMYAEPAGNVTVDNVYVTGATYGLHLVAYSSDLTWTIQNSYMDLRWANSFGVYGNGDAEIVIKGNEFDATNPYYEGGSVLSVNTFLPNVTIEENIFGENAKIYIDDSVTDTSNINISKNYHADGVDNAFADDDGSVTVYINEYYENVDADGNLSNLVKRYVQIGDNYYATLADALAAAEEGDTITLLADVKVSETIVVETRIILDLNGKTISTDTAEVLLQNKGGNFWIQNNADTAASIVTTVNGGVAIYNQTAMIVSNQDILISAVNGTAFKSESSAMIGGGTWMGALDITPDATLPDLTTSIFGGTFSADPSEWVSSSYAVIKNADDSYGIAKAAASVGSVGYLTLQDALAAAQDSDTITLLADAELAETTNIKKSITINGNGHKLTQTANFAGNASNALLDISGGVTVTFENLTFDAIKNVAVMRTVNANVVMDKCVVQNCEHTAAQGLLRLALGNATITNSQFLNNVCTMVLTFGYDAANDTDVLTVDNCVFKGNSCGETAVVYFADGGSAAITDTSFINNTVTSAGNAATLYMGWGEGYEVIGCLFDGNTVTTSHATTKRVASAIFCDGCTVSGNVFGENTATRNGEEISTVVAVAAYNGKASVNDNYWNGGEPAFTVEFNRYEVEANSYYASYNAETGALSDLTNINYVAKAGITYYTSLADAIAAANDGDVIELYVDLTVSETIVIDKALTIDGNGYTLTSTASPAFLVSGNLTVNNVTVNAAADAVAFTMGVNGELYADADAVVNADQLISGYTGQTIVTKSEELAWALNNEGFVLVIAKARALASDEVYSVISDAPVAQIAGWNYVSLQAALDAATDGQTVDLLVDLTTDTTLTVNTAITVNGNGHSVTSTATDAVFTVNAALTVENITIFDGTAFLLGADASLFVAETATLSVSTILSGYNGQTVKTSNETVANALNAANYSLTKSGSEWTVTSDNPEVAVDGWNVDTLKNALDTATDGQTVVLLRDITTSENEMNIISDITLDGNGKKITSNAASGAGMRVVDASATIKNLTIEMTKSTADVFVVKHKSNSVDESKEISVTMTDCTLTSLRQGFYLYKTNSKTLVTLNNVDVTSPLAAFCTENAAGTVYIKNGSIFTSTGTGSGAYGIQLRNNSTANVILESGTAVYSGNGALYFNGSGASGSITILDNAIVEGANYTAYATGEVTAYTLNFSESTRYVAAVCSAWETHTDNGKQYNKGSSYYLYENLGDALNIAKEYMRGEITVELIQDASVQADVAPAFSFTIEGNGYILASTANALFTLSDACTELALNNVTLNITGKLLAGYTNQTVKTNVKAIADKLNAEGYSLVEASGVWTITSATPQAQINGWNYATLRDAIAAAASGDTIELLTDVTDGGNIDIVDKNLTINGNNKLVTGTDKTNVIRVYDCTVTFENIRIKGARDGITLVSKTANTPTNVVMNNVTINTDRYGICIWGVTEADSTLTVSNTVISAGEGVFDNDMGGITSAGSKVTVTLENNVSITSTEFAISAMSAGSGQDDSCTYIIKDGVTLSGGIYDLHASSGAVDATFNLEDSKYVASLLGLNTNSTRFYNVYETLAEAITAPALGTTTNVVTLHEDITGFAGVTLTKDIVLEGNGYVIVATGTAFTLADGTDLALNCSIDAPVILAGFNGQTVTTNMEATANKLNAQGYSLVEENGVWTVTSATPAAQLNGWNYATIQEAVDKAVDGETILIINDCTADNVVIDKALTINGNGKQITSTGDAALKVQADLTLTEFKLTASKVAVSIEGDVNVSISGNTNISAAGVAIKIDTFSPNLIIIGGAHIDSTASNAIEITAGSPTLTISGTGEVTTVQSAGDAIRISGGQASISVSGNSIIKTTGVNEKHLFNIIDGANPTINISGNTLLETVLKSGIYGHAFRIGLEDAKLGTPSVANATIILSGSTAEGADGIVVNAARLLDVRKDSSVDFTVRGKVTVNTQYQTVYSNVADVIDFHVNGTDVSFISNHYGLFLNANSVDASIVGKVYIKSTNYNAIELKSVNGSTLLIDGKGDGIVIDGPKAIYVTAGASDIDVLGKVDLNCSAEAIHIGAGASDITLNGTDITIDATKAILVSKDNSKVTVSGTVDINASNWAIDFEGTGNADLTITGNVSIDADFGLVKNGTGIYTVLLDGDTNGDGIVITTKNAAIYLNSSTQEGHTIETKGKVTLNSNIVNNNEGVISLKGSTGLDYTVSITVTIGGDTRILHTGGTGDTHAIRTLNNVDVVINVKDNAYIESNYSILEPEGVASFVLNVSGGTLKTTGSEAMFKLTQTGTYVFNITGGKFYAGSDAFYMSVPLDLELAAGEFEVGASFIAMSNVEPTIKLMKGLKVTSSSNGVYMIADSTECQPTIIFDGVEMTAERAIYIPATFSDSVYNAVSPTITVKGESSITTYDLGFKIGDSGAGNAYEGHTVINVEGGTIHFNGDPDQVDGYGFVLNSTSKTGGTMDLNISGGTIYNYKNSVVYIDSDYVGTEFKNTVDITGGTITYPEGNTTEGYGINVKSISQVAITVNGGTIATNGKAITVDTVTDASTGAKVKVEIKSGSVSSKYDKAINLSGITGSSLSISGGTITTSAAGGTDDAIGSSVAAVYLYRFYPTEPVVISGNTVIDSRGGTDRVMGIVVNECGATTLKILDNVSIYARRFAIYTSNSTDFALYINGDTTGDGVLIHANDWATQLNGSGKIDLDILGKVTIGDPNASDKQNHGIVHFGSGTMDAYLKGNISITGVDTTFFFESSGNGHVVKLDGTDGTINLTSTNNPVMNVKPVCGSIDITLTGNINMTNNGAANGNGRILKIENDATTNVTVENGVTMTSINSEVIELDGAGNCTLNIRDNVTLKSTSTTNKTGRAIWNRKDNATVTINLNVLTEEEKAAGKVLGKVTIEGFHDTISLGNSGTSYLTSGCNVEIISNNAAALTLGSGTIYVDLTDTTLSGKTFTMWMGGSTVADIRLHNVTSNSDGKGWYTETTATTTMEITGNSSINSTGWSIDFEGSGNGTLTIGKDVVIHSGTYGIVRNGSGRIDLTMNGGKVITDTNDAIYIDSSNATASVITLNGTELNAANIGFYAKGKNTKATITNVTFLGNRGIGVNDNDTTLNAEVRNCTFLLSGTSFQSNSITYGTVDFYDCTFRATTTDASRAGGFYTTEWCRMTVNMHDCDMETAYGYVFDFGGGRYEDANANPIRGDKTATLNIYGGTYHATVSDAVVHTTRFAVANVYGGYFEAHNNTVLRPWDASTLNVYGGFVYFNPNSVDHTGSCVRVAGGTANMPATANIYGGNFVNRSNAGPVFNGITAERTLNLYDVNGNLVTSASGKPAITAKGGSCLVNNPGAGTPTIKYQVSNQYFTGAAPVRVNGAQIRFATDGNGIRFATTISKDAVNYIKSLIDEGTAISYGTLILPTDYLEGDNLTTTADDILFNKYTLDRNGIQYLDIPASNGLQIDGSGNVTIRAAITNLKESNYDRSFSAVGYIKYVVGGVECYLYSNFDKFDNSRSMKQLAERALEDVNDAQTSIYRFPVGDGTYSRYTEAQRETLLSYYDAEVDNHKTVDLYLIAGQSNGSGYSVFNQQWLDENDPAFSQGFENVYYSGNGAGKSGGYQMPHVIDTTKVTAGFGRLENEIGSELGLAAILNQYYNAEEGNIAGIVKYAVGGTSLRDNITGSDEPEGNWCSPSWIEMLKATGGSIKDPNRTGALYYHFLNQVQNAIDQYTALGYDEINIKGMFWMQGESDRTAGYNHYANMLKYFITDIRADLGELTGEDLSEMPFVVGSISESFGRDFNDGNSKFVDLQYRLPELLQDENIYVIDSSVLATSTSQSDSAHWTCYDMLLIGKMVGTQFANIYADELGIEEPLAHPATVGDAVAEVYDAEGNLIASYSHLSYAINSAPEGATIKLLQDFNLHSALNIANKNKITIDGNGHKIETDRVSDHVIRVIGGDVTFENLTVKNLIDSKEYGYGIYLYDSAKLTINSGYYEAYRHLIVMNVDGVSLTINGGEFVTRYGASYSDDLFHSGAVITVVINDGTFRAGGAGSCLQQTGAGNYTVNGGSFSTESGAYCIYVDNANATLTLDAENVTFSGATTANVYNTGNGYQP